MCTTAGRWAISALVLEGSPTAGGTWTGLISASVLIGTATAVQQTALLYKTLSSDQNVLERVKVELQKASKLGMEPAVLVKWKGNNSTRYDGRNEYVRVSDLTDSGELAVGKAVEVVWGRTRRVWKGVIVKLHLPTSTEEPPTKRRRCAPSFFGSKYMCAARMYVYVYLYVQYMCIILNILTSPPLAGHPPSSSPSAFVNRVTTLQV